MTKRIPTINFYQGDCMEILGGGKYDICIADPPYGIAYQSAWRTDRQTWKPKIKNDEAPYTEFLNPAFKSLNKSGRLICFYRWDVQDEFLAAIEDVGFEIKSQIVWNKVSHGMGDLKGEFAPQHELAFYATKGRYEFKNRRPKTVYSFQRISGNDLIHPNEKPVGLIKQILKDIGVKGEKVIDPFGGSFSTALACLQTGNDCDTCELDPYYFKIGKERFDRHINRWHEGMDTPIKDNTDYQNIGGLFTK